MVTNIWSIYDIHGGYQQQMDTNVNGEEIDLHIYCGVSYMFVYNY